MFYPSIFCQLGWEIFGEKRILFVNLVGRYADKRILFVNLVEILQTKEYFLSTWLRDNADKRILFVNLVEI